MSDGIDKDEKSNVISFGDKAGEKIENLVSILEQLAGKQYVIAYYNPEGIPTIHPSENIEIRDLVFFGELLKTVAINSMGMQEIE